LFSGEHRGQRDHRVSQLAAEAARGAGGRPPAAFERNQKKTHRSGHRNGQRKSYLRRT